MFWITFLTVELIWLHLRKIGRGENDAAIKAELCPDEHQFIDQCRNGHREGGTDLMF